MKKCERGEIRVKQPNNLYECTLCPNGTYSVIDPYQ